MSKWIHYISYILLPLSFLWKTIYRLRRFFYNYGLFEVKEFEVPIISVGNLTFGGTGKTPFTLWLARYFNQSNRKVLILMRGYKGKLEHSSGILKSNKKLGYNPYDFGDEALLLARRIKNASIIVGKKRAANLSYYFEKERPDIVLLDDGHQHMQIERQCNIVLFDALLPIEKYKVAPLGYMREGLTALKDADIVVIGRADQVEKEKILQLKELCNPYLSKDTPFAEIRYVPCGFMNSIYEMQMDNNQIQGKKVICMAGIASPQSFYNIIESLGAEVVDCISYPDHHFFKTEEVNQLVARAEKEDAYIITTEKDIVKLRRIVDNPRILFLEIQIDFLSGEKVLTEIISKATKID